ncbi:MAG: FAD binding domain-containing protein [Gluconobacter potus]|uniref:2Fe-2S iron-sulfur cluster binding domain-containing protein n=1 Tax=Gluconobacter potus TaxID=2724927 RepID=A0ABR9YNU8_9PROT|nr:MULTISPECIES: FAD binding domain-containing protein [Gluconobacter]MBF0865249.1 2Fe-2S iron-sulfur cluster binding domain-containing protein [Gluconobacter sp. R71656]MBF0868487.1 2Fe-2S iron-sulfur cluster binding domain-containing protein [Gluconobacter sp. R75628]MBF0874469.1 2Fe-2S iron-sulfur cluster binding domain-containing protein [Gluconobacter sp. R75629]MBF0883460.1 2Fe-2S iron-sulfur cluster binding domain-containing protein [Gluconobacter potus]
MITFQLNGAPVQIADQGQTLLQVLRDDLHLSGAKLGCGEGECGACTVLVNGRPICSCLVATETLEGATVTTIEALAQTPDGTEICSALARTGGVQCGFCTPGIVMAWAGRHPDDTPDDALEGNLCRCTGYVKIRSALEQTGCLPSSKAAISDKADLSLKDALACLAENPDLIPIAGGTDLVVRAGHGLQSLRLFPLARLNTPELHQVFREGDTLIIGALMRWQDILHDPIIAQTVPIIRDVAYGVGSPQIRNAATIGGNIATASPAGDSLPALVALQARIRLIHRDGTREMPVAAFIAGPGHTQRRSGELIAGFVIPAKCLGQPQTFSKVGPRKAQAISKLSLATVKVPDDPAGISFAFGAVGPVPMTCPKAHHALASGIRDKDHLGSVAEQAMSEITPIDDMRSTASYRRRVAGHLLIRHCRELFAHDS